jgi:transposase
MIPQIQPRTIYVKPGPTDMRKQINGLAVMVQDVLGRNPFDGAYFMFCNRRREMIKILYWEDSGFCLWTKRLEEEKFPWPKDESAVREITTDQLTQLLSGIDFWKAHRKLDYQKVG